MEANKLVILVEEPPPHLQQQHTKIFTDSALGFLYQMVTSFTKRVDELYFNRCLRDNKYKLEKQMPKFLETPQRKDRSWRVAPVPSRLINRRLDLGDVSPTNIDHFRGALNADVQGIQVDFDDGHCPNWENQILGLSNVYDAVHGHLENTKDITNIPILMFRPRPWNITEHNIMINKKKVPGPLVDFALLIFHNHAKLISANAGPFFYLSKLEGAEEAKLWNDIFVWTQHILGIPYGTIKACVIIENILSAFEMEEILYELKDHSLGLSCEIWDYTASIICKFGYSSSFVLPDRYKYVNMQQHFLKKYFNLVVKTCHARGAHATSGTVAVLIENEQKDFLIIEKVIRAKRLEIESGIDGFVFIDLRLVPYINELWNRQCGGVPNQLEFHIFGEEITEDDLLKMPKGGVMLDGLRHNIEIAILFFFHWFIGGGHFFFKDAVEDAATVEISRWQVWQWIRHEAVIEDTGEKVTKDLVYRLSAEFLQKSNCKEEMAIAAKLFLRISGESSCPEFITTYLNDNPIFQVMDKGNKLNLLKTI